MSYYLQHLELPSLNQVNYTTELLIISSLFVEFFGQEDTAIPIPSKDVVNKDKISLKSGEHLVVYK